jgi:hypothetical protein
MNGVAEMSEQQILIGYTDAMTDKQVSELAEWADYQARVFSNPRWKRGYALIREGADLILRRRAGADNDPSDFGENPQFGKQMQKKPSMHETIESVTIAPVSITSRL